MMKINTSLLLLCLPLLQASFLAEEQELDVSHRLLQWTSKTCPLGIQIEADFDITVSMHGSDVSTCSKDEMKRIGIFIEGVVNDVGSNGLREEFGASEAYFGAIMCTTESSHGGRYLRRVTQEVAEPWLWSGGGRANICARDQAITKTTASFNTNDIEFGIESTLFQVLPQHVDCLTTEFDVGVVVVQTTSMETTHYGCSLNLPKGFFDNV
jgi:hypothetical protein